MTSDTAQELRPVIGLEVHAQLSTQSKMFCGCDARYFDAAPNSHVCAVCGGMPGALPVINRRAVEYTVMSALALHCRVASESKFDRKNYSYPDIPKGYQISQYDMPLGTGGWLEYDLDGQARRCGIIRVHLEEDTGKTTHTSVGSRDVSLVDYNRSGVALMEIVTEPELTSAEEARAFFASLRLVLLYLGVCDGRLEEGSMRADVNVSLRSADGQLGTKVEIKNLNSFRAVQRALEYEIERQRRAIQSGETVAQETRGWSERQEVTIGQRSKEYAHDYRYFPEPDLPPLVLVEAEKERLAALVPELPAARKSRYVSAYGLTEYTAGVLVDDKALSDFFERTVQSNRSGEPRRIANWITGDLVGLLSERGVRFQDLRVTPQEMATLVGLVEESAVSGPAAKHVLEVMIDTGDDPEAIVEREGLRQIADEAELGRLIDEVLAANPAMADQYRGGKTAVLQALVGKVMAATRGKANPQRAREMLERKLA